MVILSCPLQVANLSRQQACKTAGLIANMTSMVNMVRKFYASLQASLTRMSLKFTEKPVRKHCLTCSLISIHSSESVSNFCSLAEIILHHAAVATQSCNHQEAVFAEHLLPETDLVSKRIEFQLATESESAIRHIIRNTNIELMRHLCLYVDVDIDWDKTPEAVRKAIIARIRGEPVVLNTSTRQWCRSSAINFRVADFSMSLCLHIQNICRKRYRNPNMAPIPASPSLTQVPAELRYHLSTSSPPQNRTILLWLHLVVKHVVSVTKWVALLTSGASEVERELWYALRGVYCNRLIFRVLLGFWRICWFVRNIWIRIFIISRRPILAKLTTMATHGASRELCRSSIVVELPETTITGFACKNILGNIQLQIFSGSLQLPPTDSRPIATATYDEDNRLCSRTDICPDGEIVSTFQFPPGVRHRWPVSKDILEPGRKLCCQYDKCGRIVSGIITLAHEQYEFIYHYRKYPKHNNALLRADYKLVGSWERSLFVFWCHSSSQHSRDELVDYDAVPSEKVTRVVRKIGNRKFTTR
jgi:hypothetical protein